MEVKIDPKDTQPSKRQPKMTIEEPEYINPEDARRIIYWYEKKACLIGSVKSKVKAIIEYDCIKDISPGKWEIRPIPGTKEINHINVSDKGFDCSCQMNARNREECSHIKALKVKLFAINWNEEHNG